MKTIPFNLLSQINYPKLIQEKKINYLYRNLQAQERVNHNSIKIDKKTYIDFSSNDYLGLTNHPKIKLGLSNAVRKYGFGSASSIMISGYSKIQKHLEEKFAEFVQRDRAILFNSGYHANLGVIRELLHRNSCVIIDKYCHASIIDGVLLSQAKLKRYQHQNLMHLERLIQTQPAQMIMTESIFSMTGSITDIQTISQISKKYGNLFYVDDAHGFGVLGSSGAGAAEHFQLSQADIDCLITPLGKALGGIGAFVSGSADLIEWLTQSARTLHYTTALPPAICAGLLAALQVLRHESWRRTRLHENIYLFNQGAKKRGLPLLSEGQAPIKSILIDSVAHGIQITQKLLEHGIFVPCIRPPTVPHAQICLRISLTALHNTAEIEYLLECLERFLCR